MRSCPINEVVLVTVQQNVAGKQCNAVLEQHCKTCVCRKARNQLAQRPWRVDNLDAFSQRWFRNSSDDAPGLLHSGCVVLQCVALPMATALYAACILADVSKHGHFDHAGAWCHLPNTFMPSLCKVPVTSRNGCPSSLLMQLFVSYLNHVYGLLVGSCLSVCIWLPVICCTTYYFFVSWAFAAALHSSYCSSSVH